MTTTRAALYLRISLDVTGERLAVDRQREDCLSIAAARGWTLAGEYVDNSISASDAQKARPGYNALCRAYEEGAFDALICWDLDRLTRQPRQLEDWIDRAEGSGLLLVTANGEADLSTDGGRLYARIKASVARAEVERKSARQRRAQRQRAEKGKPASGVRPMGYTGAGEIIEEEAKVVRDVFGRFLAGESLKGIVRAMEEAGTTTRLGGRWGSATIRGMLQNSRYTGRSIYKGVDVGEATWTPIIGDAEFAAVQARLDDPRRTVSRHGTARKYLGAGLYRCGQEGCGHVVRAASTHGEARYNYACRDGHFYRSGRPVDDYVLDVFRTYLTRPSFKEALVRPVDRSRLAELTAERRALQVRIERFRADYLHGEISARDRNDAVDQAEKELDAVALEEVRLVSNAPDSILLAADPVAAFDAEKSLERRRKLLDGYLTVTLKPGVRGSRGFDPATVIVVGPGSERLTAA